MSVIKSKRFRLGCDAEDIDQPAGLIDKARTMRLGVDQPRCKQHCLHCEVGDIVSYIQLGFLNMTANHRATKSSNL